MGEASSLSFFFRVSSVSHPIRARARNGTASTFTHKGKQLAGAPAFWLWEGCAMVAKPASCARAPL